MFVEENIIEILDKYLEVAPFVRAVNEAADSDKDALGFFPSGVYEDFARKEQLFVAIERHAQGMAYAGHILFEARHPKGRVRQIFVAPAFRQRGIAARLLQHLKKHLTDHAFISLYARVAEDLSHANRFWEDHGFYVQRTERGGDTRKRTIIVRIHELDTPQLFATSGLSAADPLGLNSTYGSETPLFLLDLNVLFDLGPRRRRNEDVLDLFRIERTGSCRLALSTEITEELARTASVGVTDPMLAYARIFPSFPTPSIAEWDVLKPVLASLVFPERYRADALSSNDISDLRHLATAIQNGLAGLITNDTSILKAAARLNDEYGIQVISPGAWKDLNVGEGGEKIFQTGADESLAIAPVAKSEEADVHRLLSRLGIQSSDIVTTWAAIDSNARACNRFGVWSGNVLLGYLIWPKAMNGVEFNARVAVDETQPSAIHVARLLLGHVIEQAIAQGTVGSAAQIRLMFPPQQAQIREVASALGFGGLADQALLSKIAVGRVITASNWVDFQGELVQTARVRLYAYPM